MGTKFYPDPVSTGVLPNSITNNDLVQVPAFTVKGNQTAVTADVNDIAASANDRLFARVADALSFTQLTDGMVPANTLGLGKLTNATAQYNLVGRKTASAGAWEDATRAELLIAGLELSQTFSGANVFSRGSGVGTTLNVIGDSAAAVFQTTRNSSAGTGPIFQGRKSLGDASTPTVVANANVALSMAGQGYDGSSYVTIGTLNLRVAETSPSSSAMGGQWVLSANVAGGISNTELLRIDHTNGIQMFGTNVVIDANRIIRPRSYTISTVPTITTTGLIHASDLGGGAGVLQSNGTAWNRVKESGTANETTEVNLTFTWSRLTNAPVVRANVALTADRTVTLSTAGCANGDRAAFVRSAAATGAFNWNIAGATTTALAAALDWVVYEFDGTQWNMVQKFSAGGGGGGGGTYLAGAGLDLTVDTFSIETGGVVTGMLADDAVTFAKMQNIATDRPLGRDTASTGDAEEITVGGGLEFTGTGGIQTSAFTGDVTKAAGGTALTVANDAITFAKMQNIATDRILGRDTALSGDTEELTVGGGLEFTGTGGIQTSAHTGDVTKAAGGTATTIANDAVSFAKMQNIATDRLIGRDTASTGDPEEITVGGGIEFTTTGGIQTSAFTGDVTKTAGGTALTVAANAVSDAKFRQSGALTVVGRSANSTGNVADIAAGANDRLLTRVADALGFTQLTNGMVPTNTIGPDKLAVSATDRLIGRDTAAAGAGEEITVGGGLEFTGTGGIQTSAFTGDVTKSAGGTAQTIANDAVSFAKMQNIASDRLIGRDTATTGDPEEITVGGGIEFTTTGGIQISAFTGDVTKTAGGTALTVANNAVSDAKFRQSAALTVVGRSANSTGNVADIAAAANDRLLTRVADALGFTQLTNGMVPTNTIGLDKLADAAAVSVLGRSAGTGGARADIAASADGQFLGRGSGALSFQAITGDLVTNTAAGNIAATTVQAAINELDSEKAGLALANAFTDNQQITGIGSGPALAIFQSGGNGLNVTVTGGAMGNFIADNTVGSLNYTRYVTGSGGPNWTQRKARGTLAGPLVVIQNDQIGSNLFVAYDGAAFVTSAQITASIIAATPSATDMESRFTISLNPPGSVAITEFMRWQYGVGLSMYGANPVIDANRIFRPRSYTISTLPTITTTGIIHCSDMGPTSGSSGAGLLQSNGTNWVRVTTGGVESIASDAAHTATWQYLTNGPTIRSATALTAARTYTLGTTNAVVGARVRICRYSAGNFDWTIAGAAHAILSKPGDWVEFEYSLAGWILVAYNLPRPSGVDTIATDAAHTYTWSRYTDGDHVRGNATLTATRTATLGTTGAQEGDRVKFTRLGGGAFDWNIVGSTTFALTGADQFCSFEFDGSAWNIMDAGRISVASGGGGSGVDVEEEGVAVATATTLNFVGDNITATDAGGGQIDVTVASGVSLGLLIGIRNSTYF